jgi:hypothetical protein
MGTIPPFWIFAINEDQCSASRSGNVTPEERAPELNG